MGREWVMRKLSNREVEQLIYGNGIYEVIIYADRYEDYHYDNGVSKWWVTSKGNYPVDEDEKLFKGDYPFCAETLKKELEKHGLIVFISEDKKRLSVEVDRCNSEQN
jgi:hypothetical protein